MLAGPERKSTRLRRLFRERYSQARAIIVATAVWTGEPECGVMTMAEIANVAYSSAGRV